MCDNHDDDEYKEFQKQCAFENKLPIALKETKQSQDQIKEGNAVKKTKKSNDNCKTHAKVNMSETFNDNNDDNNNDDNETQISSATINNFHDLDKTIDEVKLGSLTAMFKLRKMVLDALGKEPNEMYISEPNYIQSSLCF